MFSFIFSAIILFSSLAIPFSGAISAPTIAYGIDAEIFASMTTDLKMSTPLVVISDVTKVNTQTLLNMKEQGAIVVAINLPENNGIINPPNMTMQKVSSCLTIDTSRHETVSNETTAGPKLPIIPMYWISVISAKNHRSDYIMLDNYSDAMKDTFFKKAKAEIDSGVKVLSGLTGGFQGTDSYWVQQQGFFTNQHEVHFGDYMNDWFYVRNEVYECNDYSESSQREYWRVDTYIDSYADFINDPWNQIGPYYRSRGAMVFPIIADEGNTGLYEYGPHYTNPGYTINFQIGLTVRGPTVTYGWSWPQQGVTTEPDVGYVEIPHVSIVEHFNNAPVDYTWFPVYYEEPAGESHESYPVQYTSVYRTPLGSGFNLYILESSFAVTLDHIFSAPEPPWLFAQHDTYYYEFNDYPGQQTSIFA